MSLLLWKKLLKIYLLSWLKNHRLKSNADKCHVLISTNKHITVNIRNCTIEKSACEKLLGMKIDANLNFNDHISGLCKKASRKISAVARQICNK